MFTKNDFKNVLKYFTKNALAAMNLYQYKNVPM